MIVRSWIARTSTRNGQCFFVIEHSIGVVANSSKNEDSQITSFSVVHNHVQCCDFIA